MVKYRKRVCNDIGRCIKLLGSSRNAIQLTNIEIALLQDVYQESGSAGREPEIGIFLLSKCIKQTKRIVNVFTIFTEMIPIILLFQMYTRFIIRFTVRLGHPSYIFFQLCTQFIFRYTANGTISILHTYVLKIVQFTKDAHLTKFTDTGQEKKTKIFSLRFQRTEKVALNVGEKYDFSIFARVPQGQSNKLQVRLVDGEGNICGETSLTVSSRQWKTYKTVITAKVTADTRLEIIPQSAGELNLDMVSLFPQHTFKGRKNGLRKDLAQVLADIHPRFIRFPGGCVAHGDGLKNIYQWKNTVGPLEARKAQRNLWGYHQSMGLGYFEYFQFCEDIGAEPLPVVAAGVCCQNSSIGGAGQMGIPMEEMPEYIESLLNLIEWANGNPSESPWAKMRAEAGHPKPFNLKYLGVGNEDLITPVFEERFTMIFKAIKEKYPEIQVVGTSGPFSEGPDYVEGWKVASKLGVPLVDEHYYQPAGWFLNNHDYYDRYDRSKPKVYLGEYATHIPGKGNNIETALLEAYHLIGCERNGDIVSMTSYAPLLAKDRRTRWRPDLIYFNNMEVKPGTSYYTQLLFGQNSGNEYIPSVLTLSDNRDDVRKRIGISVVKDSLSQDLILKIVNLLPVKVQATIDLAVLGITGKQDATKTVLSGMPDDWKARPETSPVAIGPQYRDELPAYSLTVVKLKSKP